VSGLTADLTSVTQLLSFSVKMAEIEKGLDQCESDLDSSMSVFNVCTLPPFCFISNRWIHIKLQVNANSVIMRAQTEMQGTMQANRAATEDILLQILTNQEDLKRIVRYQAAGQHVAERVMEAGQLVSSPFQDITLAFEILS